MDQAYKHILTYSSLALNTSKARHAIEKLPKIWKKSIRRKRIGPSSTRNREEEGHHIWFVR